jgi:hypothetical protein
MTYLPIPTNVELNFTGVEGYIERLTTAEVRDKDVYGITKEQLLNWMFHNFNSMFIFGKELTLEEYKKLTQ